MGFTVLALDPDRISILVDVCLLVCALLRRSLWRSFLPHRADFPAAGRLLHDIAAAPEPDFPIFRLARALNILATDLSGQSLCGERLRETDRDRERDARVSTRGSLCISPYTLAHLGHARACHQHVFLQLCSHSELRGGWRSEERGNSCEINNCSTSVYAGVVALAAHALTAHRDASLRL